MKRKGLCGLLCWLVVLLCGASGANAAGVMVDNQTLQLTFPHLEYAGQRYHVILDYAGDLGDGLYWKFRAIEPTTVTGQCGGTVDASLNVQNACVLLSGSEYRVALQFKENPFGQSGLYWKLGSNITQNPCVISKIKGAGEDCFDMSWMERVQNCITQCGADLECPSRCMGESLFTLSVEYTNPTPVQQLCALPSGAVFTADDVTVQDMLLLKGTTVTVPASGSKTVCIPTYCLNSDRKGPDETDTYSTGGGAVSACMIEILKAVQGRKIEEGSVIQDMVWNCADDGDISESQRTYLRNLQP